MIEVGAVVLLVAFSYGLGGLPATLAGMSLAFPQTLMLIPATGEDWSYKARVLKTLELPESIQSFLKDNQQREIVKHFHLRRLLEIVRLGHEPSQLAQFRRILAEFERDLNNSLVEIKGIKEVSIFNHQSFNLYFRQETD